MFTKRLISHCLMFLAVFVFGLSFSASARAQDSGRAYIGKFTISTPLHWQNSLLQPGNYTIRISSVRRPVIAEVTRDDHKFKIYVISNILEDAHHNGDALLLATNGNELVVHSFALPALKMTLVFDPSLAHQATLEAQLNRDIPVLVARK